MSFCQLISFDPAVVSGSVISVFRSKKCHRKQKLMCGYSDILLINDLGIAKSVTISGVSL